MQKPIYSAEDEQALMAQLWSQQLSENPETFVLFAFPWGQPGTPLEHFKGPRRWQKRFLRRVAQHIREGRELDLHKLLKEARSSGRGIGKSALVSWLTIWMLSTHICSSVIISANTENQLRTVTWGELTKWIAMSINAHWWEVSATKLSPAQWLTELVERDLKKGTRLWGAEGKLWSEENPDGYAGPHNMDGMMVIFDEASGIPDKIWPVAEGYFTEPVPHRYFFAFSNGRRNTGYFFECFHAKRDFWGTDQIDARTVEGTDTTLYENIIAEYGEDSDEARIEVYGQFPSQGDDQFITPYLVEQAAKRDAYKDNTAPIVVGVDPARGGDKTVFVVRQGRDILAIRYHDEDDTMLVVGLVIDVIEEFKPVHVAIDEGGVGAGVYDRLKEQRYNVKGVNFGRKAKRPLAHGNLRAQIWSDMKDWLKSASIPNDRRLKVDLCGPRKKPNSAGVMYLEGKKEMKARGMPSPDAADALACTFAFPVAHRTPRVENRTVVRQSGMSRGVSSSWMGS